LANLTKARAKKATAEFRGVPFNLAALVAADSQNRAGFLAATEAVPRNRANTFRSLVEQSLPIESNRPGAPRKKETDAFHEEWVRLGRPDMTAKVKDQIATAVCPETLPKNLNNRKKLRDRISAAISRMEKPATKLGK
jgi:hypothetical protein